jgi:hypothetical protein
MQSDWKRASLKQSHSLDWPFGDDNRLVDVLGDLAGFLRNPRHGVRADRRNKLQFLIVGKRFRQPIGALNVRIGDRNPEDFFHLVPCFAEASSLEIPLQPFGDLGTMRGRIDLAAV